MRYTHENFLTNGGTFLGGIALDPGGNIFHSEDIMAIINDGSANKSLILVNIAYPLDTSDVVVETVAAVGVNTDPEGGIMSDPGNYIVLPCPPHCGEDVHSEANLTFYQARIWIELS